MNAHTRAEAYARDSDPLSVLSDERIAAFVSAIRHSGWGWPAENPAADALIALYGMVMESSDAEETRRFADEVGDFASQYADRIEAAEQFHGRTA